MERLLYLGSTFSLTSGAGNRSRIHQPDLPPDHSTRHGYGRFCCFLFWSCAEFFGVYKLVQSCVARPFSLLTMLSFGAFFVLLVIAVYTGVFLAALAERM